MADVVREVWRAPGCSRATVGRLPVGARERVFRRILSRASSSAPLLERESVVAAIWVMSVSFVHSEMYELVYVHLPKGMALGRADGAGSYNERSKAAVEKIIVTAKSSPSPIPGSAG